MEELFLFLASLYFVLVRKGTGSERNEGDRRLTAKDLYRKELSRVVKLEREREVADPFFGYHFLVAVAGR